MLKTIVKVQERFKLPTKAWKIIDYNRWDTKITKEYATPGKTTAAVLKIMLKFNNRDALNNNLLYNI